MTNNNTPDLRAALIDARRAINSMKVEAETAGAGGDEQMLQEACETISNEGLAASTAIDAALALTAQAQAVAHDALRCVMGNCKFNGEVDKHATGCSAAASNEEALLKALTEATRSLETIQLMAGKDDYLQDMAQVRAYATSRAMVANAAIAASDDALIAREFHESQEDSLLICASDLQHSAIYDNHAEMQSCLRAVADRILSLASPAQAISAEPAVVRQSLQETFQGLGDRAYCNYIEQMQRDVCLGWEQKVKSQKFGIDELQAHAKAGEMLGRHRAFQEAANALRGQAPDATAAPAQAGEALRVDWLLAVQPVAEVDGLGHFMTAWLTESKSPNGVAGYFVTRGASHRECLDLHLAGKGKAVDG